MHITKVSRSLVGKILIAEPFMRDPFFQRTVVLVCEQNNEFTKGIILNRPTEINVSDAVSEFPSFISPLYLGGPTEENILFYVHRIPKLKGGSEITPGIFFKGDYLKLCLMADTGQIDPKDILFFSGIAYWEDNDLLNRVMDKIWIPFKGKPNNIIFSSDPKKLWVSAMYAMGGEYREMSNYPLYPSLN